MTVDRYGEWIRPLVPADDLTRLAHEKVKATIYWLSKQGMEVMIWKDSAEHCAAQAWSLGRAAVALRREREQCSLTGCPTRRWRL